MSLVVRNDEYVILDEQKLLDSLYPTYALTPMLYAIDHPFMMDSQAKSVAQQEISPARKRKRKMAKILVNPNFEKVCNRVESVHKLILSSEINLKLLQESFKTRSLENIQANANNKLARECAANCASDFPTDIVFDSINSKEPNSEINSGTDVFQGCKVHASQLYSNWTESTVQVHLHHVQYIIPPFSQFYLGSAMEGLQNLATLNHLYDLIVIDPPWENKSVKRKKSYYWDWDWNLIDLPIHNLLSPDGIIILWTTNNKRQLQFAHKLAKKWGSLIATWRWLKVTTTGQSVCPFLPHHKVPFENVLLIGKESKKTLVHVDDLVICSVPCAIPGSKPHLTELLKRLNLLKENGRILDVFGRCLLPASCTVGYEAIKFNQINYSCWQSESSSSKK